MRISHTFRLAMLAGLAGLGATALTFAGIATPAQARVPEAEVTCFEPTATGTAAEARGGRSGLDHRGITAAEQAAIERRTAKRLGAGGFSARRARAAVTVPVHVHVMRDAAGNGDVTDQQITQQIAVLDNSFSGTGFSFTLARTYRYNNNQWHHDRKSSTYRQQTRQGGANALNMWLVDFKYLGIATFPWDYAKNAGVDGIRVHYASLPGGSIANYDLGETATHEAGHWFGLYHTFQGGCTERNDEVDDTAAQSSPTTGCPEGRDSCSLPGVDPIHNYMDYSYDSCYTEFTPGQSNRADQMWAAYRG